MTSENLIQISNPRRPILKRSASVTHLTPPSLAGLTLRDAKSFSGNMEEVKSTNGKFMEKAIGNDQEIRFTDGIETRDLYNNDTILVSRNALVYKGTSYSINDIAFRWKKDCRMWLWKNTLEVKKNKSVGDHIKEQLIKG